MVDQKEFVGETKEAALQRAASHFGVPESQLDARVISDQMEIRGLGAGVMILVSVRDAPGETEDTEERSPVGEFLNGVLERMHLSSPVRIRESEEDGEVVLTLRGGQIADLAQRDDRLLGALAHVVERALPKLIGREATARVEVGFDDPALIRLEREARARADEVRRTGQPVVLDGMNSRQRWIVHSALRGAEGVRTESVGEGRFKRIKIVPA